LGSSRFALDLDAVKALRPPLFGLAGQVRRRAPPGPVIYQYLVAHLLAQEPGRRHPQHLAYHVEEGHLEGTIRPARYRDAVQVDALHLHAGQGGDALIHRLGRTAAAGLADADDARVAGVDADDVLGHLPEGGELVVLRGVLGGVDAVGPHGDHDLPLLDAGDFHGLFLGGKSKGTSSRCPG
jgi:hypothetical protein